MGSQEPQFSSWDDVFKERQAASGGAAPSDSTGGSSTGKAANVGSDRVSSAAGGEQGLLMTHTTGKAHHSSRLRCALVGILRGDEDITNKHDCIVQSVEMWKCFGSLQF